MFIIQTRGVLLENIPLVNFIQNYIRDLSGVFSISSLVRMLMMSFPAFSVLLVQTVSFENSHVYIHCNKEKITQWLEDTLYEFYFLVLKTIFSQNFQFNRLKCKYYVQSNGNFPEYTDDLWRYSTF